MRQTIEERAEMYARHAQAEFPEICAFDYATGARDEHFLLTEWHDIETDKDGFATEAAMSKLWEEKPVIVENIVENSFYVLEEPCQFADLSSDLETKPHNFKWRKLYIY